VLAQQDAELEQATAASAVLQRTVSGQPPERSQPDAGRAGGGGSPWTLAWITRSRRTARDYDRLTAHQQVMVQAVEL